MASDAAQRPPAPAQPSTRQPPADQQPAARYPAARRLDGVEDLFGHRVADPYRWLEDPDSPESRDWLSAEEMLWDSCRDDLPARERFANRVRELLQVGSVGTPVWRGSQCFYTRRDPGQEHAVLYVADERERVTEEREPVAGEGERERESGKSREAGRPAADGENTAHDDKRAASERERAAGRRERALVDPNAIDPSGRTTLDSWSPDKEGRLIACQLSSGGTEESAVRVLDIATGALVDGPIDRCRYSGVAWLPGGKAFYYTRRLPPDQVPEGESQYHRRVYLHTVGTDAETDTMIFGEGRDKTSYYGVGLSQDGRWLTLAASMGTAPRRDLWIADLMASDAGEPALVPVTVGLDTRTSVWPSQDGRLYVYTDLDAPRGRIAVTDPGTPGPETWRDLIPQDPEAVLRDFAILDDLDRPVMLVSWTRHAIGEITVHDLATGERLSRLELPGIGTVGWLSERPEGGHEAWFSYTDYTTPSLILRYDAADGPGGTVQTWATPPGTSSAHPGVTARQVMYHSGDGTPIRMVIVEPAGVATTRSEEKRSFVLYGYGGFDVSMTPGYSANILAWAEAGGGYAIAALRGGSEEGEEWHRAGMLARKQNVFDDFHAAAEYLISSGLTSPDRLAVWGGSNGGLLVGAAVTQRPSLFAAAVCSAPLLDMVRYERFGLGQLWNSEYGSASVADELEWLLGYSPYHRVVPGTAYPAVLFTVFSNDTRVDPLHAYKMCAALQHASASRRPVLLRAEAQVGHGARAVSRTAELSGDTLAFVARETRLGLTAESA